MFGKKSQPPIKSLIAQGTRIEGNMKFNEGLRVDGEVFGDIQAITDDGSSMLVISEAAVVQGAISADHVIINGTVRGPVHARLSGDGLEFQLTQEGPQRQHAAASLSPRV